MMFARSRKTEGPSGPFWKRLLRTVLISVGTALVVKLVDTVLFPGKPVEKKVSR